MNEREVKFFVFGDAGQNTRIKYKVAKMVNKEPESKLILLGDNFYRYGILSETDDRWKNEYDDIFPNKKIYACLGNHCYMGNISSQIKRSEINKNWVLPARYYDKKIYLDEHNYLHLICLDTFEIAQTESIKCSLETGMTVETLKWYMKNLNKRKQLNWLNDTLKQSTAKWKIVFGHYPIYSNGMCHGNCKEMVDDVLPILATNNVNLYLSGHDHSICYSQYKNLHIIVSGNGCYSSSIKKNENFCDLYSKSGICYLSCKTNELEFGFNDLKGNKIFSRTLS
jgi:3',5'-cyclic AMP phosphodiesterase CpdA